MRQWTQKEMDALYEEIQKKAMTDREFREKLLKDTNAAVEEMIGEPLPEGAKLKAVERDPAYTQEFVIPDFVGDELSQEELDKIADGDAQDMVGISYVLIVSICLVANSRSSCKSDICVSNQYYDKTTHCPVYSCKKNEKVCDKETGPCGLF